MKNLDAMPEPDAELKELVSRFLDDRLDAAQRDRLEERLQQDATDRAYCAEQLRFASALHEIMQPQRIEMVETRRMVLDQGSALVEQNRSVRYGEANPVPPTVVAPPGWSRKRRWAAAALALLLAGGVVWQILPDRKADPESIPVAAAAFPVPLELRNGGFETDDLSLSPRGLSDSLEAWGDGVRPAKVQIMEISRVTEGKIFAKSGKNVASFLPAGSINQRLQRKDGSVLTAREGLQVRVTGWVFAEGQATGLVMCALRFIASGRPDMRLYEAAGVRKEFTGGSWQRFSIDLKVTGSLMRPPYSPIPPAPEGPIIDLAGRDLYLAVVSRCRSTLLVDDLEITEITE